MIDEPEGDAAAERLFKLVPHLDLLAKDLHYKGLGAA